MRKYLGKRTGMWEIPVEKLLKKFRKTPAGSAAGKGVPASPGIHGGAGRPGSAGFRPGPGYPRK
jgi:hypothetical protein